jgi:hypothetical protein
MLISGKPLTLGNVPHGKMSGEVAFAAQVFNG